MTSRMNTAGRRIQDWTNRNVFVGSFDSVDYANSYQNAPPPAHELSPHDGTQPPIVNDVVDTNGPPSAALVAADPHAPDGKPITALQAAWNVTNAIRTLESQLVYYIEAA